MRGSVVQTRGVEPIVTPAEMRAIDAAAIEPVEVLIERAGSAVSRTALNMLGGTYGRRVAVIAGKGNNGKDGLVAARRLEARGVRVALYKAGSLPAEIRNVDLVIDAAYGTGLRGEFFGPSVDAPVLAVDIPSGVDGLTGVANGSPLRAERTVTFAALKPGLVIGDGPSYCGDIELADIGLNTDTAKAGRMTRADAQMWLPRRAREAHKWHAGVRVLAGSEEMSGAGSLACEAAMRSGAGIVVASGIGIDASAMPTEVITQGLPTDSWPEFVLKDLSRFKVLLVGPGFGTDQTQGVAELISRSQIPVVVDADALEALRTDLSGSPSLLATPHDGEFAKLMGRPPGEDRFAEIRAASREFGVIMLLKGPTTLVCDTSGFVTVVDTGDQRLGTAGSGDVLGGCIAALVAQEVELARAAALGAFLHGLAGLSLPESGLVAGDLPAAIAREIHLLVTQ